MKYEVGMKDTVILNNSMSPKKIPMITSNSLKIVVTFFGTFYTLHGAAILKKKGSQNRMAGPLYE